MSISESIHWDVVLRAKTERTVIPEDPAVLEMGINDAWL